MLWWLFLPTGGETMRMVRKDESMRKKSLPKVDKKVGLVRESEFRRGKL